LKALQTALFSLMVLAILGGALGGPPLLTGACAPGSYRGWKSRAQGQPQGQADGSHPPSKPESMPLPPRRRRIQSDAAPIYTVGSGHLDGLMGVSAHKQAIKKATRRWPQWT